MEDFSGSYEDVILENEQMRLVVGENCLVKSLVHKGTGQECLVPEEEIALFSVTQTRPFNNEVKLAHPNKRTTFQANRLRREDDRLVIGFEIIPYQAVVTVKETAAYISFELSDFIVGPEDYGNLKMDVPPVLELRLIQLPVRHRKNFGEWLNVSWDDKVAVSVLAISPGARIDSKKRRSCRIMVADAAKETGLKGTRAALITSTGQGLLDNIDQLEKDYGLPLGVESRRSDLINASIYWTSSINPANVAEHIKYAKMGGFRLMLIYYPAIFHEEGAYMYNGNYDYNSAYPRGKEDLLVVLDQIKAAGLVPGLHFLHTHIGIKSRYVTPVADHRLNLTRRFTLARPLDAQDTTVFVEENPQETVMADSCRVLKFAGELITYQGYTTEPPYQFFGCVRGAHATRAGDLPAGLVGGILDVSEFGGTSIYLNQHSSLQDEIALKIADVYNAGFKFVYFDGSEGTNPPFAYHVPQAQYRVLKSFATAPLFTEGAAKAHFSWHFLSGGNAFDIFPPEVFKEKIRQFPAEQAPRMRQDFTRLNFGWWGFWAPGTQADMFEYGTSRAAAWDCPVTVMEKMADFKAHPRLTDILEVLRRWEDVRAKKWLSPAQKLALQDLEQEHILLQDPAGAYELVPYAQIEKAAGSSQDIRAFAFTRKGLSYIVFWHNSGSGRLALPLAASDLKLEAELDAGPIELAEKDGRTLLPVAGRAYLSSNLSLDVLVGAMQEARLLD